ncbi:hypothetical protein EDC94DRAFT_591330 [Helicostylum pulchrum]|uniref:Nucleotide-diphospho-sugar transferase domain-containing protein n=1 Tax=Helicostylum pulchrum TaxID=562976 RepID=A0ABP9Y466_9FUNG|nr:hypothetical protein EDC94DRAFT_591330 [Helicostylum pulchrum]
MLPNYFKYGLSVGFMGLIILISYVELNKNTITPKKTSADYFVEDQHFFSNSSSVNPTVDGCNCLFSTENMTLVPHGENVPVFIPDALSPMEPDILDKIAANRRDDGILITIAGYAMRNELYNWIELLKEAREDSFIVFCTDPKLYLHLIVAGYEDKAVLIPDDWFISDLELFRSTENNMLDNYLPRLSHIKTWVLQRLSYVKNVNNVFLLDVNQIMVHARTREYLQTLLHIRWDTQLITTQDSLDQHVFNTGLIMMRTDAGEAKRLLENTVQIQEIKPGLTQQEALNKAMDKMELHVKTGMTVLLDVLHFPNGIGYFENNLSGSKGIEPYIIHINHKFGEDRRELLKLNGFWKLDQEYIDSLSEQVEDIMKRREEASS